MHTGRTVFSQLMDFIPKTDFEKCVQRYKGNYRIRKFSCYNQYLCMSFAQLTYRESLRDIETCLRAMKSKLYHAGIRGYVSKSTLADANENRDWRIYADFALVLIRIARKLYVRDDFGVKLDQIAYVLDSSIIDLCLSLFPWARFRKHKAAIKLHTLMDLRGNIPCFICMCSQEVLRFSSFVPKRISIAVDDHIVGLISLQVCDAIKRLFSKARNPRNSILSLFVELAIMIPKPKRGLYF